MSPGSPRSTSRQRRRDRAPDSTSRCCDGDGLPDVAAAEGSVASQATQLIGRDGKAIVYGGAPNLGFSIANGDSPFNPLSLVTGAWPKANEVVINKETADKEDFDGRRRIGVQVVGPVQQLRISGIGPLRVGLEHRRRHAGRLRPADGPAHLRQAGQARRDRRGRESRGLRVAAGPGDRSDPAAAHAGPNLPGAVAGGQQGHGPVRLVPAEVPARLRRRGPLRRQLRDRQLALDHDRPAHAGVRDAAHAGRFARPGAALRRPRGAGDGHPRVDRRTVRGTRARRRGSSRCSMRSASRCRTTGSRSRRGPWSSRSSSGSWSRCSPACGPRCGRRGCRRSPPCARGRPCRSPGSLATGSRPRSCLRFWGFAGLLVGLFVPDLGTGQILLYMLVGAVLVFFGVALFSVRLVGPLAWILGWPATRVGAVAGALARDNSKRNPQRTASTASALMIGLALVTLVSMLAAGIVSQLPRRGEGHLAERGLRGHGAEQLLADPDRGGRGSRQDTGRRVRRQRPGRRRARVRRQDRADRRRSTGRRVFNVDWIAGSPSVLSSLGADGAFVDSDYAKSHQLKVGSPVQLTFANGEKQLVDVKGIFDPPTGGSPFGRVTISAETWDRQRGAAEPLLVRAHARRPDRRESRRARAHAEAVSEREGRDTRTSSSTTRSPGSARS